MRFLIVSHCLVVAIFGDVAVGQVDSNDIAPAAFRIPVRRPSGFDEPPHRRPTAAEARSLRVTFEASANKEAARDFIAHGLALLHAGRTHDAWAAFKEAVNHDQRAPMAWLGIALSNDHDAGLMVMNLWRAFQCRESASPHERRLIEIYADAWGAREEPPTIVVDAERGTRRAVVTAPDHATLATLDATLLAFAASKLPSTFALEVRALVVRERLARLATVPPPLPATIATPEFAKASSALIESIRKGDPHHPACRYARGFEADSDELRAPKSWRSPLAMPFDTEHADGLAARDMERIARRPGTVDRKHIEEWLSYPRHPRRGMMLYPAALRALFAAMTATGQHDALLDRVISERRFARTPEVLEICRRAERQAQTAKRQAPETSDKTPPHATPSHASTMFPRATWTPPTAPALALPKGRGGAFDLANRRTRPVLIVFYLGFGCVHCVEQLQALAPRAQDFERAGIDIVTVGTDSVDRVKASLQMGVENDRRPLPFVFLCDPERDTFKTWGAWGAFENEALHGTFLVDPSGKIRWADVSVDPFMDVDFLLAECARLAALP